ncbi:MAG: 50S ribosomal protein L4 [Clostridiales bacterium]|jgi:large subunit ribosomal protein L4|nr:50S ribosomal protein L4 [Clostridiales bacterium]
MAKVSVIDYQTGKTIKDIDLKDEIFGAEVNEAAIHTMVVNYLANQRQGTQNTRTRTEVRGGGRKPWRQKGSGRARQGSIRSPQWKGGGVALGPKPRSYRFSVNKKLRRVAMKSALTMKLQENKLIVVNKLDLPEIKTKSMVEILSNIGASAKTLIVTAVKNENVVRSGGNIPNVRTTILGSLNVYDVLKHDSFVITEEAVEKLQEVYA